MDNKIISPAAINALKDVMTPISQGVSKLEPAFDNEQFMTLRGRHVI